MLMLWALVLMLSFQVGTPDQLEATTTLNTLQAFPLLPAPNTALDVVTPKPKFRKRFSTKKGSPSAKSPDGTIGGRCPPVAKYFLSESKLNDYLNSSLPAEIEKLFKCEEVNLAGVLGSVLATVSNTDLLSALDLGSILNMEGGGLGDILGQGSSGNSKGTDLLGGLLPLGDEGLGGLLGSGGKGKGTVKGLLEGTGLSSLQQPLDDVVGKATDLKESARNVMNKALPPDVSDALTNMLGGLDLDELLLGLQVQEVTVDSINSTTAKDGIHVLATTTAVIGGKGLAGPVISLLGFHVYSDVTLTIGISTNDTQCVNLQVQSQNIQVNKVTIQVVETVTDVLPVSLPLPLDSLVAKLLSVELNKNAEEAESCDIVLSGFNDCKNSTGLFQYHVKMTRFSPEGLSVFYCAEFLFGKNVGPVPGRLLPPHPKNANISLTLSHTLLDAMETHITKQSTFQANNLQASITKMSHIYKNNDTVQVTYRSSIKKDGESYASGESVLVIWYDSKISKDKVTTELKLVRSDHSVTPPEKKDEVQEVMTGLEKKLWSVLVESLKNWNVPAGATSNPLNNAKVNVIQMP
ncbi:vomeromodulin-like [Ochotona curzoniae]|uniref:vomeromodulin-like n=1 Tax=Ochotona curzoniae TaxID=130825 RepID=UPI001B34E511|nr:vomeromodulin-like [Ochotona curzoniae]